MYFTFCCSFKYCVGSQVVTNTYNSLFHRILYIPLMILFYWIVGMCFFPIFFTIQPFNVERNLFTKFGKFWIVQLASVKNAPPSENLYINSLFHHNKEMLQTKTKRVVVSSKSYKNRFIKSYQIFNGNEILDTKIHIAVRWSCSFYGTWSLHCFPFQTCSV